MERSFREKLKAGDLLVGTLVTLAAPEAAEIFSRAGFDWLFIDMEHSPLNPREAVHLIQAAGERAACILRVPLNDEIWLKKALDTGCDGVLIPQVNSKADALRAVRFCKYPPQGTRSVGITRAQGYGADGGEYLRRANNEVAVIVQIEHKDAVAHLSEILEVEGIDAALIGPYDLSSSMGLVGQLDVPEVKAAIEHVRLTCKQAGMPLGIFSATTAGARRHLEEGYRLIAVSSDILMLVNSSREILKDLQKKM
jgi:2-keto-3-deoxy-L-rhamnonate aldolase RhmA